MQAVPVGQMPGAAAGGTTAVDAMQPAAAAGRESPPPLDAATPRTDAAPADAAPADANAAMPAHAGASADAAMRDAAAAMPSDAGMTAQDSSTTNPPGADDRCDLAKLDPARPPTSRMLSGSLATHDPSIIESKGTYYVWFTGPRLPAKTSTDLTRWSDAPAAFGASNPAWIARDVPEATDLWAPDVSFFSGQFHLYYAASKFGSNSSCIGHATKPALDSGSWMDQGSVICSNHGTRDDWNAIDPNVVVDHEGRRWLAFGSFWSGIKAIELDEKGARANGDLHSLATRPSNVGGAIEAPFIVRRCGYYYLFASFDKCCDGVDSTYNIRVGRSKNVMGPYVDMEGVSMLQGGGTQLVKGDSRYHGPGHNAVLFTADGAFNIYHAYDGQQNGRAVLRVSELVWNDALWPVSGGP
jgi:arabinan endo-1,5-alpha-L-arabinosidase